MKSLMRLWALLLIGIYLSACALPLVAFAQSSSSQQASFAATPLSGATPLTVTFMSPYGYPEGITGASVVLEISQHGKECHTPCAIYHQAGTCVMPTEGIFGKVLSGGTVKVGDRISRID